MANCKCDDHTMNTKCSTPSSFNPCLSLLTPKAEADLRALKRTFDMVPIIAALAAGASSAAIVITAKSVFWTFCIDDFVASLASNDLDSIRIVLTRGSSAVPDLEMFGGKFGRAANNPCSPCTDRCLCVGPLEALSLTITNTSGAALNAADTATLVGHMYFAGEEGFVCGPCTPTPTVSFNVEVK